jgi:hypothetical protein
MSQNNSSKLMMGLALGLGFVTLKLNASRKAVPLLSKTDVMLMYYPREAIEQGYLLDGENIILILSLAIGYHDMREFVPTSSGELERLARRKRGELIEEPKPNAFAW